jgi:hypothetical protein
MNSASQNFPHHLGMLRERMLYPTEYELAVNYFLEEFAGDVAFVRRSEPDQMLKMHDTGLLMLIPGIHGQIEVARFHLKGGCPTRDGIDCLG